MNSASDKRISKPIGSDGVGVLTQKVEEDMFQYTILATMMMLEDEGVLVGRPCLGDTLQ